jgi:tetratricopeptide (TPR) repeat protein
MGYQIIPNVIFIISLLGIIIIVLKNLTNIKNTEYPQTQNKTKDALLTKGLPILTISKLKNFCQFWGKKILNFILEAKDLRHITATGYKIKKIIQKNNTSFVTNTKNETLTEQKCIERIKTNPKNLENYDDLGKIYLEQEDFAQAKDIYLYLTGHNSGNSDYFAKLAFTSYKLQDFAEAVKNYQKSIALDSTHPNRYYNLGLSNKALGNTDDAISAFKKALELEPKNLKYQATLNKLISQ